MPQGSSVNTNPDLPYTVRAKRVLEAAMTEARDLGHAYVGTEHLTLGTVADENGTCALELAAQGVTVDQLRVEIVRLLGSPNPEPGTKRDLLVRAWKVLRRLKGQPPPDAAQVKSIAIELENILRHLEDEL